MKAALSEWLAAKLGEPVEITEWRRHAEGFSWQTYTFRAGSEAYAVRREPEDGLLAPYDTEGQYRLHEALLRLGGVPVPRLRWLELDPSVLGMPFYVMDRVDGHVPVQWKPDDPIAFPDEAARRSVGEQFVDALAAIHALDWRATGRRRAARRGRPLGAAARRGRAGRGAAAARGDRLAAREPRRARAASRWSTATTGSATSSWAPTGGSPPCSTGSSRTPATRSRTSRGRR